MVSKMFKNISTIIAIGLAMAGCSDKGKLSELEEGLSQSFNDIEHITPTALTQWRGSEKTTIIFDVREEDEFAVSHIEGAIHISPKATAADIQALLPENADGSDVIFYCSVGARSSQLAQRSKQVLQEAGVRKIANLRGGIFRWHNEKRSLQSHGKPSEYVHPYNRSWRKLLERQDYARMQP